MVSFYENKNGGAPNRAPRRTTGHSTRSTLLQVIAQHQFFRIRRQVNLVFRQFRKDARKFADLLMIICLSVGLSVVEESDSRPVGGRPHNPLQSDG